jgi:hypothetical protein
MPRRSRRSLRLRSEPRFSSTTTQSAPHHNARCCKSILLIRLRLLTDQTIDPPVLSFGPWASSNWFPVATGTINSQFVVLLQ